MLTKQQLQEIRDNLDSCKNPLFFFDDDQDGLSSFLLLYRYKKEGNGFIVKTTPKIDEQFVRHVANYNADKVFILDIAVVEQEFIDNAKVPVVWIDHHNPLERYNVKYFNPRINGDSVPTTYMCYNITRQDLWIAMVGCIADWHIPEFIKDFRKQYPDLIDTDYKVVGDIIYNTKLGKLIRIISFILKGKKEDVSKSIRVMARVGSPYEILNQETAQGRFLYKRYEHMSSRYEPLMKELSQQIKKINDKLVVFKYKDDNTSFTSDLSNEAIYRFPNKIILVAREKEGEMKCSIRSNSKILPPLIDKAMAGLKGFGGGHEYACGLNIDVQDFDEFVRRFRGLI